MVGVTGKLLATLRALVREMTAHTDYHALIRYRVVSVAPDKRLRLQIVRKASGFPDVLPISIVPGLPGGKGEPAAGAIVLVSFIEGDPSMPIVTHFSRPDDPKFLPVNASLDATGTLELGASAALTALGSGSEVVGDATGRVIRYGDSVSVPGVGVVILGLGAAPVAKVKA